MFATEPISIHENSYKTGRIRGDKFSRERCFVGTESYQCITKIKQKVILFTAKEKHTNRHNPPPQEKKPLNNRFIICSTNKKSFSNISLKNHSKFSYLWRKLICYFTFV